MKMKYIQIVLLSIVLLIGTIRAQNVDARINNVDDLVDRVEDSVDSTGTESEVITYTGTTPGYEDQYTRSVLSELNTPYVEKVEKTDRGTIVVNLKQTNMSQDSYLKRAQFYHYELSSEIYDEDSEGFAWSIIRKIKNFFSSDNSLKSLPKSLKR